MPGPAPYPTSFRCMMKEEPYQYATDCNSDPGPSTTGASAPDSSDAAPSDKCRCVSQNEDTDTAANVRGYESPTYISAYQGSQPISAIASQKGELGCRMKITMTKSRKPSPSTASSNRCPFKCGCFGGAGSTSTQIFTETGSIPEYPIRRLCPAEIGTDEKIMLSRCHCTSEDEYFSLSPASSETNVTPCPPRTNTQFHSVVSGSCRSETRSVNSAVAGRCNMSGSQNAMILQLLRQVANLIDNSECKPSCADTDGSGPPTTKADQAKKANIDNGPGSSSIKITFNPKCKDNNSSSRQLTDCNADMPQMASVPMPMQMPMPMNGSCNLFIAPPCICMQGGMYPNVALPPVPLDNQTYNSGWNPGMEKIQFGNEDMGGVNLKEKSSICKCATLGQENCPIHQDVKPLNKSELGMEAENEHSGATNPNENPSMCLCATIGRENCPMHQPLITTEEEGLPKSELQAQPYGNALAKVEEIHYDQNAEAKPTMKIKPCHDVSTKSEMSSAETGIEDDSDIMCDEFDEDCRSQQMARRAARKKNKRRNKQCDCCHCRAVREQTNLCTAIAIPEPKTVASPASPSTLEGCQEIKFFIDSIIMDLDAMEHARRKKQMEQNITPKMGSICPRQSFPVTIVDVTDLGMTSLFVKWVIHDCFGIGGYEIYVDGYLTNRYFHCNHEAAVVCDVDVTTAHKIVLVAQPAIQDSEEGKSLICKCDCKSKDRPKPPSDLWVPSIYLYEPSNRGCGSPIIRN